MQNRRKEGTSKQEQPMSMSNCRESRLLHILTNTQTDRRKETNLPSTSPHPHTCVQVTQATVGLGMQPGVSQAKKGHTVLPDASLGNWYRSKPLQLATFFFLMLI